uniref:hypothetical protein n=1 Tax=Mycobacterium marinum TaxID=1781 RepID=UPI0035615872
LTAVTYLCSRPHHVHQGSVGPGMRDPIDMVAQLRVVRLVDVVDFDVPQKFLQHISGELVLRFAMVS